MPRADTGGSPAPGPGHDMERQLSIFDEPKIDCHNHVYDPARFEFSPKACYLPAGAERGTRSRLTTLFEAYGVQRALVIQPSSGYDDDNCCLLDVLARGEGQLQGMTIVANDASRRALERLRALRDGGVTFNAALLGVEYYSNTPRVLAEPAAWACSSISRSRLSKFAERAGIKVITRGPYAPTVEGGSAAADIGAASGTTALVAFNDLLAIGVLQRLQHLGIDVPGDVGVVGFDDIFGSDFCHPPLTTVSAPVEQAGRMLIDLLLGTRDVQPASRIVLWVRDSTGPAASR